MAKVISILMNKGGVSKTETSLNLAYGLSVKGKKVLLIDMDPSSNATICQNRVQVNIRNCLTSTSAKDSQESLHVMRQCMNT